MLLQLHNVEKIQVKEETFVQANFRCLCIFIYEQGAERPFVLNLFHPASKPLTLENLPSETI